MKNGLIFFTLLILILAFFFRSVITNNYLPIPADTIIGLYHPYRDYYSKNYPNGIPYKNFLITDPVRQQYPWRNIAIEEIKELRVPTWNPYNFSGNPLIGSYQSAVFYPFNLFFFFLPFSLAWTFLVILQLLLGGIFLFLFFRHFKIDYYSSFFGTIAFIFSGFSIAWLEWNTILHVALWLPLILLAQEHILNNRSLKWIIIFILANISAILAGHLQTLFYLFVVSNLYLISRLYQNSRNNNVSIVVSNIIKKSVPFFLSYGLIFTFTAVQLIPLFKFITFSARDIDQMNNYTKEGWFIPWQHSVQLIVPDFFGNPTTLNYWGVWNYGEFIAYVGVIPLLFALFALFFRHDKKTLFFGAIFFVSLIFAFPTFIAKIPYFLHIPFISTAQPTRLIFIIDFSLAILAALGFDYFRKEKKKIIYPLLFMGIAFISLWTVVLFHPLLLKNVPLDYLLVAKRNLIFPSVIFGITFVLICIYLCNLRSHIAKGILIILLCVTVIDLMRFGQKFTPFAQSEYLFPSTAAIHYLKSHGNNYRIMSVDQRILPPNFSASYKIMTIEGYDPLYLKRYGQFIAAIERNTPNISPPLGFNRIITLKNYESKFVDLLGVKYVLSLSELKSAKLKKVFQEGETRIYENTHVMPRAFFVSTLEQKNYNDVQGVVETLFNQNFDPKFNAVVESSGKFIEKKWSLGKAEIVSYTPDKVIIKTSNSGEGFLVLTDNYYPTWKAEIRTTPTIELPIYITNYTLRGMIVPKGDHTVVIYNSLL